MWKKYPIFIYIFIFLLTACIHTPIEIPTLTLSSGIEGTVTQGPMCPGPEPIDSSTCPDQPYQTTISILAINKTLLSQIQTDDQGNFKIQLIPGTYILHPESGKPFPRAADQTVEVKDGLYTMVSIVYDTGMR